MSGKAVAEAGGAAVAHLEDHQRTVDTLKRPVLQPGLHHVVASRGIRLNFGHDGRKLRASGKRGGVRRRVCDTAGDEGKATRVRLASGRARCV